MAKQKARLPGFISLVYDKWQSRSTGVSFEQEHLGKPEGTGFQMARLESTLPFHAHAAIERMIRRTTGTAGRGSHRRLTGNRDEENLTASSSVTQADKVHQERCPHQEEALLFQFFCTLRMLLPPPPESSSLPTLYFNRYLYLDSHLNGTFSREPPLTPE